MKTKRNRVLALVLCLTLVLSCAGIAYADNSGKQTTEAAEAPAETELPPDTISDDEAVYVLTDAAGTVENIIVSDRIQEANGEESVTKTQEQKDLPVDVRFTYRLDGREIAPEELAGKSGRVEIRIDYTNNAWAVKEISGKEENLCVPFLTLSALLLDNEHFSNVTVENGKLVNDGTRTVVVGYAFPGMGESLALPEELDLTIPDHVTVTADAKDFALGSVYTLVANNLFKDYDEKDPDALQKLISSMNELTDAMDQLMDGAQALNDGLDTLLAKSEDLTNGVSALCDGADQVASGADTLKTGAEKLASGTRDVKNGADQLAAGAGSLLSGADQLAGGAAQLSAGLDQLSANSAAINNGAENVFASLLSAAEAQLKANGLSISTLTISNYQPQLNQLIASLDPDAVYAQALAQVTAGVEARRPEIEALVTASVREQVTAAVTASARQTVSEQVHAAVTAQIQAAVEENRPMIEAGVRTAVEAQIREKVTTAVAAQVRAEVIQTVTGMSVDDYEQAVSAGEVSEEVQAQIAAAIKAQMGSDEVAAAIDGQITAKMNSEEIQALIASTTEQKIEETVQAKLASSEIQAQIDAAIEKQMASDEVQALIAQNIEAQMASKEIQKVIADNTEAQVQKAIADTMEGSEVQGKLATAAEGAKSVIALKTSLDQYNAFYLGIQSYTAGVDAAAKGAKDLSSGAAQLKTGAASLADGSAALASGTKTLSEGADALSSGAATLSGGTNQLAAGTHTMKDSLPDLIDGITQLRDGSDALRTGMEQFNADGIQKLSQLVTVDGAGFAERLKAIASIGKEYRSAYTGLSDDAEGELRFIYRTAAIGE